VWKFTIIIIILLSYRCDNWCECGNLLILLLFCRTDAQRGPWGSSGVAVLAAGRCTPHRRAAEGTQPAQDGRHRPR
jgi:hypothetical protein